MEETESEVKTVIAQLDESLKELDDIEVIAF